MSEESFESVRLRAEQGDAKAQYNLGLMYVALTGLKNLKRLVPTP